MLEAVKFSTRNSYKLLPKSYTRNKLVNREYKNNIRVNGIFGEVLRYTMGLGSAFAFAYGATTLGNVLLANTVLAHVTAGEHIKAKNELRPTYKEIVKRAKNWKAIREYNAMLEAETKAAQ